MIAQAVRHALRLVDVISPPGRRHVALLVALILFFALSPWLQTAGPSRIFYSAGFSVIILAAVLSAQGHRILLTAAAVLAVPALLANWLDVLFPGNRALDMSANALIIAFHVAAISSLMDSILRRDSSNIDTICGALACYLLMAEAWAVSYELIDTLQPGSLSFPDVGGVPQWTDYLYYSLTTLTTLGYGDITPVRPFARIWATLEAATGTLYVAVAIAGIVGSFRR